MGRIAWVVGVLLLAGSLVGAHFYLKRPSPSTDDVPPEATWNVVSAGHVDAEHGVSILSAPFPGRVVAIPASEGQTVRKDDVLMELDDTSARLSLDAAEAALKSAELQAEEAKKIPEQHRIRLSQQQQAVEAARQRLIAARSLLENKRRLANLTTPQVSSAELVAAEAEVRGLESGERVELDRLRELQLSDPALKVRQVAADFEQVRVKVDQAKHALEQCKLKAPTNGQVLRINVAVGDIVGATPRGAIMFRPEGALVVRAEIDQEFAYRVKKGQRVTVTDEASLDSPTWTGRVEGLSDWITRRRSILLEPDQINDVRTLEGVIRLDESPAPLRIGQRVRVMIHPD